MFSRPLQPAKDNKKMAVGAKIGGGIGSGGLMRAKNSKPEEIRKSNIQAARALSDAIRTSLGPRGMDKMIQDAKGEVGQFHLVIYPRICNLKSYTPPP